MSATALYATSMRTLFLLVAAASCGGNVVVDTAGTADAGTPDCALVCARVEAACPAQTGGCATMCASVDALIAAGGTCVPLLDAWFVCLDENPASPCTANGPCMADEQAFSQCSP